MRGPSRKRVRRIPAGGQGKPSYQSQLLAWDRIRKKEGFGDSEPRGEEEALADAQSTAENRRHEELIEACWGKIVDGESRSK